MNVGDRIEVTGGPVTHHSWVGKRGTILAIETSSFHTTWVVCNMDEEGQVEFRKASLTVVPLDEVLLSADTEAFEDAMQRAAEKWRGFPHAEINGEREARGSAIVRRDR